MTMYTVVIDYDPENGSYGASSPDVDDEHSMVVGIGKSADEAVARFRNALQGHFEFLRERGEPIPQPRVTVTTVPAPELEDAET
jgi:predicted RNase H-like HicB family nuclease